MVQQDSFSFDGVDMLEAYGIRMIAHDVLQPRLRPRLLTIPGRDGSYDFGANRYDDRLIRLDCDSRRGLTRDALRSLSGLLSRKGRIVLYDEPEKFYTGRLYDDAALAHIGRIGHAFELAFICEPFAQGETVRQALGGRVQYGGTAETPAIITLRNTGAGEIARVRMIIRKKT